MSARLIPWAWLAFAVRVTTGTLLFSSEAVKIHANPTFRLKMVFLLLAGSQALIFQTLVSRKLPAWDDRPSRPVTAKVIGLTSILLWLGIVTAGRFIGFV